MLPESDRVMADLKICAGFVSAHSVCLSPPSFISSIAEMLSAACLLVPPANSSYWLTLPEYIIHNASLFSAHSQTGQRNTNGLMMLKTVNLYQCLCILSPRKKSKPPFRLYYWRSSCLLLLACLTPFLHSWGAVNDSTVTLHNPHGLMWRFQNQTKEKERSAHQNSII